MGGVLYDLGGTGNGPGCIDGVQGGEVMTDDFCCLIYDAL